MIIGIITIIATLILSTLAAIAGFASINITSSGRASLTCSILFLISNISNPASYSYIMFKLLTIAYITIVYFIFSTSNHFIISLDIAFFFSILMLILHQALKMFESLSVK